MRCFQTYTQGITFQQSTGMYMAGFFPNFNFSPMREHPRVSNVRSSLLGFPSQDTSFFSIVPLVFGNVFNTTNATEIALSQTLQTMWVSVFYDFSPFCENLTHLFYFIFQANFAKNPSVPPAPNWEAYTPANEAIADLGFGGNVEIDNVVQLVNASFVDRACGLLDTVPR